MQISDNLKQINGQDCLVEKTVNEYFQGKDKSQPTPVSYGELVCLMQKLLEDDQSNVPVMKNAKDSQTGSQDLIEQLWQSDQASALTNQAARKIEQLSSDLQTAVNERNAAWFQLEEAGIKIAEAQI